MCQKAWDAHVLTQGSKSLASCSTWDFQDEVTICFGVVNVSVKGCSRRDDKNSVVSFGGQTKLEPHPE